MHLNAARCLASRVPSSDIARSKTPALLGESLDFNLLETDNDDDLTEVLDGSANNKRLIKRYMLEQAKNFRELETLVMALDHMETISATYQVLEEQVHGNRGRLTLSLTVRDSRIEDQKWQSELKRQVAQTIAPAKACLPGLYQGWLTTSQLGNPSSPSILTMLMRSFSGTRVQDSSRNVSSSNHIGLDQPIRDGGDVVNP
jgi:nuclear pore complex protein Nup107